MCFAPPPPPTHTLLTIFCHFPPSLLSCFHHVPTRPSPADQREGSTDHSELGCVPPTHKQPNKKVTPPLIMTLLSICTQVLHSNPIGKFPVFFAVRLEIFPVPISEICDNFICRTDFKKFESFPTNIAISSIFRIWEFTTWL